MGSAAERPGRRGGCPCNCILFLLLIMLLLLLLLSLLLPLLPLLQLLLLLPIAAATITIATSACVAARVTATILVTIIPITALVAGVITSQLTSAFAEDATITIRHPSATTATASDIVPTGIMGIMLTGTTFITAIIMIPARPPPVLGRGWHLTLPVPPASASDGGCPVVAMAKVGGVVVAALPTSGGVDGRGSFQDEDHAAAITTALL